MSADRTAPTAAAAANGRPEPARLTYTGRCEFYRPYGGAEYLIEWWETPGGEPAYLARHGDRYLTARGVTGSPHAAYRADVPGEACSLAAAHAGPGGWGGGRGDDPDPATYAVTFTPNGGEPVTLNGVRSVRVVLGAAALGLEWGTAFAPADPDADVYATCDWTRRDVEILGTGGETVYAQKGVEAPASWDDQAVRITASKFFYGDAARGDDPATGGRESSVRQLVRRVAETVGAWGEADEYFATHADAVRFTRDLTWLCLHQHAAFNSPVWFNVGLSDAYGLKGGAGNFACDPGTGVASPCDDSFARPQCAACYIQPVDDSIAGIMELAASEARLFKHGSGTGTDVSTLRSCREKVTGGGRASGPVSFMRIWDAVASTVKSGGRCLAPYQPVFTASGCRSAKELADAGKDFTVLSFSKRLGRVAAKNARAWQSATKPVVAVITDKGEFHVSHDHPFMLKTGRVVRAADLRPGLRLMAVTTSPNDGGYVRVGLLDGMKGRTTFHRLVANDRLVKLVDSDVVHHGPRGKLDSEIDNITVLSGQEEHARIHAEMAVRDGTCTFQNRVFPKTGPTNGMHASAPFWDDDSRSGPYREKQGVILTRSGRAADMQAEATRSKMLNTGYMLVNAGHDITTFERYVAARRAVGRRCPSIPGQAAKFLREFGGYAEFYAELSRNNHEVIGVRPVGVMDVYSVEVDDVEPDDKRPWSEHNYTLAPLGTTTPFMHGAVVLNSRRAAKMQTMKVWHPDVREFFTCKRDEDRKARALIASGAASATMTGSPDEAYSSVMFQNSNLSVRLSDAFLDAAETPGAVWQTRPVLADTDEPMPAYDASGLLDEMAACTHEVGDPGYQFEDTIQSWNTCPNSAPINSSNPCCFVGPTEVNTSEGRFPISNLAALSASGTKLPLAFSFDFATGLPVLRPIVRAWRSGFTRDLVEVRTDKGLVFLNTPDHVYYLRDGSGVAAKDLRPGMRLRKVGRGEMGARPRTSIETRDGTFYQSRWMWEQVNGPVPEGYDVHHANEDRRDDRLSNFELRERKAHKKDHATGPANARYIEVDDTLLVETWEAVEALPRRTFKYGPPVTVARWNKYVRDHGLFGRIPLARGDGRIRGMSWADFSAWVESRRSLVNDRVTSVETVRLAEPVAVYDLEVEGTHRFEITCPGVPHGVIVANSEYMHVDNSACNLASLNLLKFVRPPGDPTGPAGTFDVPRFRAAVRTMTVAQDILVDRASYPTAAIAETSHQYRQLGLGYGNLGALLMDAGLPYDSDAARWYAAAVTAVMQGQAMETSAELAAALGPYSEFGRNADAHLAVAKRHRDAGYELLHACKDAGAPHDILLYLSTRALDAGLEAGRVHGYRNAQHTLLAPTGTIGFMMGYDTFGVEPDIALVKYKSLAGGGLLKMVNRVIPGALRRLGYGPEAVAAVAAHVEARDTIEGCPLLDPSHLAVFDCAFEPPQGGRSIAPPGHVRMMAAVQPFLSGAISKCIVGDSVIATANGLMSIESFYRGEKPDTFRPLHGTEVPTGDGSTSRASDFYYGGVRPTWKVTLSDGRSVTGTAPHRLRVATPGGLDWKELPELRPGDFVGVCLGSECWGECQLTEIGISATYGSQNAFKAPDVMSRELGTFLGMLAADGHLTPSNYTVGFTKDDSEARGRFKELLFSLFGLPGHDVDDDRRAGGEDGFTGVTVGSKALTEWLKGVGWTKERVPACVLGGPREGALGYLSGLYLDGWVTKTGDIAISQKRRSLLGDVQLLWDNLGVATYFTSNPVDGVDYPVLHALGSSRRRMADLVDWIEPHKAARAASLSDGEDRRSFPLRRSELESAVRERHRTGEFRSIFDRRTAVLSRPTFLKAAEAVGLELTAEELNLLYVPVVSVEYAGEQAVFDLSVPGPEAFIANGIVNHNTVNLPAAATPADIRGVILDGWRLGLKALAVYRDQSKGVQPLNVGKASNPEPAAAAGEGPGLLKNDPAVLEAALADFRARSRTVAAPTGPPLVELVRPRRERLPDTRRSLAHKFSVDGHEGYLHTGFYADGRLGELFVRMAKEGSTIGGLMDALGTSVSIGLQYGVPLEVYAAKFAHGRYEPAGMTGSDDPQLRFASSLTDYVFRWLALTFPGGRCRSDDPDVPPPPVPAGHGPADEALPANPYRFRDAKVCPLCGAMMPRVGNCYTCLNCGTPGGCS